MHTLLVQPLRHDTDVVIARRAAGLAAELLGFDAAGRARLATAVAEIAGNAFRYGRTPSIVLEFDVRPTPQQLIARVEDHGPGIPELSAVLERGAPGSPRACRGLAGARRLVDSFAIESSSTGTRVTLGHTLPRSAPGVAAECVAEVRKAIAGRSRHSVVDELAHQHEDLMLALGELQRREEELRRLDRELDETNRGVVALYAELDERALRLREAAELKSRFLSNMSHEFRTPVNSIIGQCELLQSARAREGRPPEPEVGFIRDAARHLRELVDDLLDLAKVDAGKALVRVSTFEVEALFGALRGMLRPLLADPDVALTFEGGRGLPPLETDEAKVSQILRNLISNALKFTERGEVRVSAALEPSEDAMLFTVADTGIGIAVEDQRRIFDEFTQLEHRLKRAGRGTGLGLPLSQRLAETLRGTLTVTSEPGAGSTFRLRVPLKYSER